MKWISALIAMSGLVWFLPVEAQANCSRIVTHYDNLQISREVLGPGVCFVSAHPMSSKNLVYRNYLMTTDGLFMIFNSYGEGESSKSTGAREYYFFPRGPKTIDVIPNEPKAEVVVRYGSGLEITFDTITTEVKSISGGQFKIDRPIRPDNKGGIEVTSFSDLFLDAGFQIGKSPVEFPKRLSKFIDSHGQSCQVSNADIFKYSPNEVELAKTDAEIKKLVQLKCPNLQIKF